jgi:DNA (cytosine-5)-methyltransferase 1
MKINYLEGFSGYCGFGLGLLQSGFEFNKHWYSEIDKYAIANTKYNFPNAIYAGAIQDVSNTIRGEHLDLFTFGWPCQDNSIAGKRKGQTSDTRSGLLYEAVKVIERYKPRNFIAENVAGLLTVNKGIDIVESLKVLAYLNDNCPQYDIEMQLLNTRWFLPQNRERLFFVGHLRGSGSRKIFPIGETTKVYNEKSGQNNIANCLDSTYHKGWLDKGQRTHILEQNVLVRHRSDQPFKEEKNAPTLRNSDKGEVRIVAQRGRNGSQEIELSKCDYSNTITSVQKDNMVFIKKPKHGHGKNSIHMDECPTLLSHMETGGDNVPYVNGIRRLTPIECERLQGLPDNWTKFGVFKGETKEISDTQRYKLCGNGVSIPVIEAIGTKLIKTYEK